MPGVSPLSIARKIASASRMSCWVANGADEDRGRLFGVVEELHPGCVDALRRPALLLDPGLDRGDPLGADIGEPDHSCVHGRPPRSGGPILTARGSRGRRVVRIALSSRPAPARAPARSIARGRRRRSRPRPRSPRRPPRRCVKRTGIWVRKPSSACSQRTPSTLAREPVMPTSEMNAVPFGSTRASAVGTWVWVPTTAPARPSRCQPIATFSEVTSAWKSTKKASAWSRRGARAGASASGNGERAARSCTCPIRLITQTRAPATSTITWPWPGLPAMKFAGRITRSVRSRYS